MLHTFPDSLAYDQKLQVTDLAYLFLSGKARGRWRRTMWGCRFEYGARPGVLLPGTMAKISLKHTE